MKKMTGHLVMIIAFLLVVGCSKDPILNYQDGTFTDPRDKQVYKFVQIGTQIWMAENLAYLPLVNTTSEGSDTEPRYYVYDLQSANKEMAKTNPNYTTYGILYNWVAAKKACPSGWHLPTDAEWKILEISLGMSQMDADGGGYRYSGFVGKALKSISGWKENGNGNNSSGFAALAGGGCHYDGGNYTLGDYKYMGSFATFWSASESDALYAWTRDLVYDKDAVNRGTYFRGTGFSVRCLRN